jgi:molybdopterin-guanine dinucleotide biosynthesis protein A
LLARGDDVTDVPSRLNITLGILAGGRATRLGGLDKAWLQRNGVPQVLRWRDRFATEVSATLVSANRDLPRYRAAGLMAVPDSQDRDVGPLAGLAALASACRTPWLLTLPVDLVGVNECLVPTLIAKCDTDGAHAVDDDGMQPLVALWRVQALDHAIQAALATDDIAVQSVQRRLVMACVDFPGVRFGNLNTPEDLVAAGVQSMDHRHE